MRMWRQNWVGIKNSLGVRDQGLGIRKDGVVPPSPCVGCLGSKCFRMLGSGGAMSRKYVLLKGLVPSVSF